MNPNVTVIKASERVAHGIDCAHCYRDALVVTHNGIVCWKSAHDGETHANAIGMNVLLQWYMMIANTATLLDMRRVIDERLEKLAA